MKERKEGKCEVGRREREGENEKERARRREGEGGRERECKGYTIDRFEGCMNVHSLYPILGQTSSTEVMKSINHRGQKLTAFSTLVC